MSVRVWPAHDPGRSAATATAGNAAAAPAAAPMRRGLRPVAPIRAVYHAFKRGAGLRDEDVLELMAKGRRPITRSRLRNVQSRPSDRGQPNSVAELLVLINASADEQVQMDAEAAAAGDRAS